MIRQRESAPPGSRWISVLRGANGPMLPGSAREGLAQCRGHGGVLNGPEHTTMGVVAPVESGYVSDQADALGFSGKLAVRCTYAAADVGGVGVLTIVPVGVH